MPLQTSVKPGTRVRLLPEIAAPLEPGTYVLVRDLINEPGLVWGADIAPEPNRRRGTAVKALAVPRGRKICRGEG